MRNNRGKRRCVCVDTHTVLENPVVEHERVIASVLIPNVDLFGEPLEGTELGKRAVVATHIDGRIVRVPVRARRGERDAGSGELRIQRSDDGTDECVSIRFKSRRQLKRLHVNVGDANRTVIGNSGSTGEIQVERLS